MKEAVYTKSISINLAEDTFEKIKEITDLEKVSIAEWFGVRQNWHSTQNRRKKTMTVMKNKMTEILTPSHKLWPMFRGKLDSTVTIYRDEKLHNQCKGDLTLTTGILDSMTNIDIKETLIFFNEYGGSCDCKVLVNVARIWNNQ